MAETGIVTRIGCPDICPDGVDVVGLPPFKDRDRRSEVPDSLQYSIGSGMDESQMVPLEQSIDGVVKADNGYADDMFPICEHAVTGQAPEVCPKRILIQTAINESLAMGSSIIQEG